MESGAKRDDYVSSLLATYFFFSYIMVKHMRAIKVLLDILTTRWGHALSITHQDHIAALVFDDLIYSETKKI